MKEERFFIGSIPVVVYGDKSDKTFIFVHGLFGNKEEGQKFAEVALYGNYQVISLDLPEHGERNDDKKLLPWVVKEELKNIYDYAKSMWNVVSVRATSIGCYFSLLAFEKAIIEKCLFVSPLVDMVDFIRRLMYAENVSEASLKERKFIPTKSGQPLDYDYYIYAKNNRVKSFCDKTYILRAALDKVVSLESVEEFVKYNGCSLTRMPFGEHFLHTETDFEFLSNWEKEKIKL